MWSRKRNSMIQEFPRNQTVYLSVDSSCSFPTCPWRPTSPSSISVCQRAPQTHSEALTLIPTPGAQHPTSCLYCPGRRLLELPPSEKQVEGRETEATRSFQPTGFSPQSHQPFATRYLAKETFYKLKLLPQFLMESKKLEILGEKGHRLGEDKGIGVGDGTG